jgi:hypothetical protein
MLVRCKIGGEMIDAPEGQDAHRVLDLSGCSHCVDNHPLEVSCRETAAACPRTHMGPCWNPPNVPERPAGCTVCRPILFLPNVNLIFDGV